MNKLTKVYQTNINADTGNCFQACLASITGLSIDVIPLFRSEKWVKESAQWLFEHGFQLTFYKKHRTNRNYYIVGCNPFLIRDVGWRCHTVVYKEGQEVHDPISNRSKDEIITINQRDGIAEEDILQRHSGIVYTIILRSLNRAV